MKYERLPRRRQFRDERLMKQKRNTGVLWVPLDSVGTIAPEGRAINAPHKICQPTLQQCCTVHVLGLVQRRFAARVVHSISLYNCMYL